MRELVWYAQLDVYDTVRRFMLLISACQKGSLNKERLYVSDFYLVNPSLLDRTKMTQAARDAFRALRLPKSDFLDYPPPPVLFEKMSGVQSEALQNLVGRGLLDLDVLRLGKLCLTSMGEAFASETAIAAPAERKVLSFLAGAFLEVGDDHGGLRSATGLRRVAL